MVAKRRILILKIFIVLFSCFFIILWGSELMQMIIGNYEERVFSKDAATESFIYYNKINYQIYRVIELLFLISLLLMVFFKKVQSRYLLIFLFANILLILLPLIITK